MPTKYCCIKHVGKEATVPTLFCHTLQVKHSQCECLLAKASLYLLSTFTDDQADRPTLAECVWFPGREGSIVNIPQEIGTKYYEFGLFLLEDDRIRAIAYKHMNDAEQINCEVLRQWIADKGKHPVTWKTLCEVLRDIELYTLAGEIEAVKCDERSELNLN